MLKVLADLKIAFSLGIPFRKEILFLNIILILLLSPVIILAEGMEAYLFFVLLLINLIIILRNGYTKKIFAEKMLRYFEDTDKIEILDELLFFHQYRYKIEKFRKEQADQKLGLKKFELVRGEFLDNFSHEIKTPMFAVLGYLETLQNQKVNDEKMKLTFLSKAYTHAQYLNTLLNDMIDLSFLQSGQNKLKREMYNIYDAVMEVIESFEKNVAKQNLYLKVNSTNHEAEANINVEKFQLAMSHLLSNALKFTNEGGVTINLEKVKNVTKINVIDTGVGIPEDEIDRIFERLYKTKRDRDMKMKGSGMGLAIVKHIILAHNSSISVHSTEGVGTTFNIELID